VHAEPGSEPVSLSKTPRPGSWNPRVGDAEIGAFRQGTPASRWALTRYLAGRAIAEAVGRTLLVIALVVLVLGAACWAGHLRVVAALLFVVAVGVLLMRVALLAVLRRLTAFRQYHPLEERLVALVRETRGDVHRELRRLGLPSRTLTLPLLAVRLLRRRSRGATLERLSDFRIEHVVPAARVDELHLLLRSR
jgi:hypothetical protein